MYTSLSTWQNYNTGVAVTLGNALHPMQKTTEQITMGASNNFHSKSRAYKWKQYFILHLISPCPSSSAILPKPTPVKKKWKKKNTKDLSDLSKPFLLLEKKRQRDRQTDRQTETEKKGGKNTHTRKRNGNLKTQERQIRLRMNIMTHSHCKCHEQNDSTLR